MRIETPTTHRFPWYVRLIFALQRRRYALELEPARLRRRSPKIFLALSLLYGMLDRKSSPLNPALRSLITVRVSQVNWCAYCVDINSATDLKRSVGRAQLETLKDFDKSPLFSDREKVALLYTDAMTYSDRHVDTGLMSRLKEHFDDDAIIELTALIAFQNLSSKFNAALAVPAQGVCQRPGG